MRGGGGYFRPQLQNYKTSHVRAVDRTRSRERKKERKKKPEEENVGTLARRHG